MGIEQPPGVSTADFEYSGWAPAVAQHRRACKLFRSAALRLKLVAKLRRSR